MSEIIQWRKLLQSAAIQGRSVLKQLQAEHLTNQMGSNDAEEFAEKQLKEQGLEDVAEFMAGSAAAGPER